MKTRAAWMAIVVATCGLVAACEEPNAPRTADVPPAPVSATTEARPATQADQPPVVGPPLASAVSPGSLCNLEFLDDADFGPAPMPVVGNFKLRGWVGHDEGGVIDRVELVMDGPAGQAVAPVARGLPRPDVAAAYPSKSGLADSGFVVQVDPSKLPPGDYHLYLRYSAGAALYVCDNGRHVTVSAH